MVDGTPHSIRCRLSPGVRSIEDGWIEIQMGFESRHLLACMYLSGLLTPAWMSLLSPDYGMRGRGGEGDRPMKLIYVLCGAPNQ